MRKRNVFAAAAVSAGLLAGAGTAHAGTPVNWQAKTCQAVTAYGNHPSLHRLESQALATALVYDALHISGRSYFKADAEEFGADQATPSRQRDKLMDVAFQYLKEDQQSYC